MESEQKLLNVADYLDRINMHRQAIDLRFMAIDIYNSSQAMFRLAVPFWTSVDSLYFYVANFALLRKSFETKNMLASYVMAIRIINLRFSTKDFSIRQQLKRMNYIVDVFDDHSQEDPNVYSAKIILSFQARMSLDSTRMSFLPDCIRSINCGYTSAFVCLVHFILEMRNNPNLWSLQRIVESVGLSPPNILQKTFIEMLLDIFMNDDNDFIFRPELDWELRRLYTQHFYPSTVLLCTAIYAGFDYIMKNGIAYGSKHDIVSPWIRDISLLALDSDNPLLTEVLRFKDGACLLMIEYPPNSRWKPYQEYQKHFSIYDPASCYIQTIKEIRDIELEEEITLRSIRASCQYITKSKRSTKPIQASVKITQHTKKTMTDFSSIMSNDSGASLDTCANCNDVCGDYVVCGSMNHMVCRLCAKRLKRKKLGCPCCSGTLPNPK